MPLIDRSGSEALTSSERLVQSSKGQSGDAEAPAGATNSQQRRADEKQQANKQP